MKKSIPFQLFSTVHSCGENDQKKFAETKEPKSERVLPSADYSSLLVNYECDMDVPKWRKFYISLKQM